MTVLTLTLLLAAGSCVAGFLGSLTGLGGGVVIVPLLMLVFGVDIRYAIGASLVSVIATSSGAAAAYVKDGFSNMRVGHVPRDRHDAGRARRRVHRAGACPSGHSRSSSGWCCWSAFLGPPARRAAGPAAPGPAGGRAPAGRELPDPGRPGRLPRAGRGPRVRPHVARRRALRPAGHRLGRVEGAGDGPDRCACRSRSRRRPATS